MHNDPLTKYGEHAHAAWERIKSAEKMYWSDWSAIGEDIENATTVILTRHNLPTPNGKQWAIHFGDWLTAHHLDDIDKGVRSRLKKCMEKRAAIEEWRGTLTPAERTSYNSPNTVWGRWISLQPPTTKKTNKTKTPTPDPIVFIKNEYEKQVTALRDEITALKAAPIIADPSEGELRVFGHVFSPKRPSQRYVDPDDPQVARWIVCQWQGHKKWVGISQLFDNVEDAEANCEEQNAELEEAEEQSTHAIDHPPQWVWVTHPTIGERVFMSEEAARKDNVSCRHGADCPIRREPASNFDLTNCVVTGFGEIEVWDAAENSVLDGDPNPPRIGGQPLPEDGAPIKNYSQTEKTTTPRLAVPAEVRAPDASGGPGKYQKKILGAELPKPAVGQVAVLASASRYANQLIPADHPEAGWWHVGRGEASGWCVVGKGFATREEAEKAAAEAEPITGPPVVIPLEFPTVSPTEPMTADRKEMLLSTLNLAVHPLTTTREALDSLHAYRMRAQGMLPSQIWGKSKPLPPIAEGDDTVAGIRARTDESIRNTTEIVEELQRRMDTNWKAWSEINEDYDALEKDLAAVKAERDRYRERCAALEAEVAAAFATGFGIDSEKKQ